MDSVVRVNDRVVPAITFNSGNARLSVLSNCFLTASAPKRSFFRFLIVKVVPRDLCLLCFRFVRVVIRSFRRSVRDRFHHVKCGERCNVLRVVICHFRGEVRRFFTRLFSFFVGVRIASPTRVSAFRKANFLLFHPISLYRARLSDLTCGSDLSQLRFVSTSNECVRNDLGSETLKYRCRSFVIRMPRDQAGTPQVTRHGELATANRATSRVTSVPLLTQDFRSVTRVGTIFCDIDSVRTFRAFLLAFRVRTLRLTVRAIPRLFRRGVYINVFAQVLTINDSAYRGLVRVNRIRVTTRHRVLNAPIIATRRQVRMKSATFSNDKVARVPRVCLSNGKGTFLNMSNVVRLFEHRVLRVVLRHARCLYCHP